MGTRKKIIAVLCLLAFNTNAQKDDINRFHVLLESMKDKEHGKIVISELGFKRFIS